MCRTHEDVRKGCRQSRLMTGGRSPGFSPGCGCKSYFGSRNSPALLGRECHFRSLKINSSGLREAKIMRFQREVKKPHRMTCALCSQGSSDCFVFGCFHGNSGYARKENAASSHWCDGSYSLHGNREDPFPPISARAHTGGNRGCNTAPCGSGFRQLSKKPKIPYILF